MIIDYVTLNNVGVYRGLNQIELTPTDKSKPVILFGGLNGGGKTTFLDAVHLVLYGRRARCASRGSLSYRDYLKSLISRGADPQKGAFIELSFRRHSGGQEEAYTVRREWNEANGELTERLLVQKNSLLEPLLSENWDEFIENYIPYSIANLFFFDGEQIAELADPQQAQTALKTAIHALLGLDLVDRLQSDLTVLERKRRVEQKTSDELQGLEDAERQLSVADNAVTLARQVRAQKSTQLDRLHVQQRDLREKFRQEGGELYERSAELSSQRAAMHDELKQVESSLKECAAGSAPLTLMGNLLNDLRAQALVEEEASRAARALSTTEARDKRLLDRIKKSPSFSAKSAKELQGMLAAERDDLVQSTRVVRILNAGDGFVDSLDEHIATRPKEMEQAVRLISSFSTIKERLSRIDDELNSVPEEGKIAELQKQIHELDSVVATLMAEINVQDLQIDALDREIETKRRVVDDLVLANNEAIVANEETSRILTHSAKVRSTISAFKQAVVQKHSHRLSQLILESFQHLLRKSSLVSDIRIDASTFELKLIGSDGDALQISGLSAGERQLLATSILWGLAKASGRPLPTIIDTPLGRLDSSHRSHLVSRYFPAVSHQMILLSTDEEISERYLQQLGPYIGRSYQLMFSNTSNSTAVTNGYFWNYAPAN